MILLISASSVARMTSLSYHAQLGSQVLNPPFQNLLLELIEEIYLV
jgi:hypothetical protein